jgi:hypothetical protein
MKKAAFAMALLLGGAAFAQTSTAPYDGDGVTEPFETSAPLAAPLAASDTPAPSGAIVQPGNASPERDARGIAVISAPAMVPAGWNGTVATAMGGPLLDPATGEPLAARDYPPCTAAVTDHCLQIYERGRR